MVGVESTFDKFTLDTLPHSIILTGKKGCGKHVLAKYISDKFNLGLLDITEKLSEELIENIYLNPIPTLYLVDLREIVDKEQNVLLKLFEEPAANSFVVLLANNTNNILPTILNRGKVFNIPSYDKNWLKDFAKEKNVEIDDNYFGSIVETPGDILEIYSSNVKLNELGGLCDKIINKLNIASYPNTLTIVDKFNYKDEYDKLDVDFFFKMIKFKSLEEYKKGNIKALTIFKIVCNDVNKLADSRLNKKILLTNMLTELWEEIRK